ncbi:MAG: DUF58 domain-containing protein [Planctomycetes bacterium]|nr:DUF58 domain-containing protein [Planctomycetota bacterium]
MDATDVSSNPGERFDTRILTALSGLDMRARYLVEGFLHGLHESPFHGLSVEFSEYRDYQPGDDLRHLDWQLFARSDRLYVKRYTQETNVRVYVLCDTSGSMAYRGADSWASKLEVARSVAAALVWMLLRQNDAAGLLTLEPDGSAQFVRPSQKPSQFGIMLHLLQALRPAGGACLRALLEHATRLMHRRSMVLLFSDFLEPAENIAEPLRHLRFLGHECLAFQVLDRDEIEFPFAQGAVFEDLESGMRRSVAPAAVRQRYLERFHGFMRAHDEQFRSLEMLTCRIETHKPPWEALAMFLARRKRML